MLTVKSISDFLDQLAPTRLAENWDNVGLLVGDPQAPVQRIMTCLTITPASAQEAINQSAELIVSHHPLPFHPLKKLTTDQTPTRLLWQLIRAGISIYSPHTGFDSASDGINQNLAMQLDIVAPAPLIQNPLDANELGAGRVGKRAPIQLAGLIDLIKQKFQLQTLQFTGDLSNHCTQIAVGCGSGGTFLSAAVAAGCDTFVTGEASFHTCLEAQAQNVSLILMGHYASERFAVERLANQLQLQFPHLAVWASQLESDPVQFR